MEPVTLSFPANYPLCAPLLELRNDFSRSHPHINPGPEDHPPVPCVVEGSLTELLHASGLESVLNQISAWLDNAANETLIDSNQGWEPVRRDTLTHIISADAGILCEMADGQERPWFVACNYWYELDTDLPGIASHVHAVSRNLLRRLSGVEDVKTPKPWILLGAGSLGSHIAIGLGRMGDGPAVTVDNDYFSPHNAARHALLPDNAFRMGFLGNKAFALREALLCLAQNTEAVNAHVVDVLASPKLLKKAAPRNTWAVVNATASLAVRDALLEAAPSLRVPVIEAAIWGRGAAATLLVEGVDGNPNVGDMVAALYERARSDSALGNALLPKAASHAFVETGQGCRSSTMTMPDAVVAQFASAMSLVIADLQHDGLPLATGRTWIGLQQGIRVQWQQIVVQPSERIEIKDSPWTIRIGTDAHQAILEDIGRFPSVETGGVLMGRISEATRTFYVTGIVPAPDSSVRRADCFVLETKGLKRAVERYSEETAGTLYCLGTWHSHRNASGPSALDRQTAEVLKDWRIAPSVMLIHHPLGYQASITESIQQ